LNSLKVPFAPKYSIIKTMKLLVETRVNPDHTHTHTGTHTHTHTHTHIYIYIYIYERAILAARSVARAMAQKERERKQAVGHHHPPAASDGAKPDCKVRFRV